MHRRAKLHHRFFYSGGATSKACYIFQLTLSTTKASNVNDVHAGRVGAR